MFTKNSAAMAAVARWVFGFIKFQFQCGQTWSEIESAFYRQLENGNLDRFYEEYERVYREINGNKGVNNECRAEQ